jgi:tetratricopeptide (TPR) repeat protein
MSVLNRCFHRWFGFLAGLVLMGGMAQAQGWTEAVPFTLGSGDLRRASAGIPTRVDYPVVVLLQSESISVDAEGKRTFRYHLLFRVESLSGLGSWANVEAGWSAWFEQRPEVRSRVIAPDGTVSTLDPATLKEYQPNASDAELFADRKLIKAPLPQLRVGSLVETEITRAEHRPFSRAGTRGAFVFVSAVPVQAYRCVLEVPEGLKLNWKWEHLSPDVMQTTAAGGRVRHAIQFGPSLPPPPLEPLQDPAAQPLPMVKFGSTPTWTAAAQEYEALVQPQIRMGTLRKEALEARGDAKERRAVVAAVLAYVQRRVRYVALEFGDAAIVPRSPGEVLGRGFGDCKDKSTLLVALLGELGIKAELALVRVGNPWDTDPEVPGLGVFDHCIVHVPGPEAIWIDPAAQRAKAGVLPVQDQGRWALLIGKNTPGLVRTPRLAESANRLTRQIDVQFPVEGSPRLTETTTLEGTEELSWRMNYGTAEPQALREFLKRRLVQTYRAKDLGKLDLLPADDLTQPYRVHVEVEGGGIGNRSSKEAWVVMNPWPVVSSLEESLQPARPATNDRSEATSSSSSADLPRLQPLTLAFPFVTTHRWVVHVPEGYGVGQLPARQTWAFGPATLEATFTRLDARTVETLYRLTCATRIWTPAEVMAARKALRAFGTESSPVVRFQQEGEALLAAGKIREALGANRRAVAQTPGDPTAHIRLSRTLLMAGQGLQAQAEARRAVDLQPASAAAWSNLGWILQHDGFGRRFEGEWDRAAALGAYRKALELDPKHAVSRWQLGVLLERDARGQSWERPGDLTEAEQVYRSLASEIKEDSLEASRMLALAHLGRYDEGLTLARAHQGASTFWNGWTLAFSMLLKGRVAGLESAAEAFTDPTVRSQALVAAGEDLFSLREYPAAAEAMNLGALRHERQARILSRAGFYALVSRQERPAGGPRDPRTLPFLFLSRLLEGTTPPAKLREFFTLAQRDSWTDARFLQVRKRILETSGLMGQPSAVAYDALRSSAELKVEGSDAFGYVIHIKNAFLSHYMAVASEEGTYRLVSVGADAAAWARQALACVERQDLPGAGSWIDWAVMRCGADNPKDPTQAHPVHRIRVAGKVQGAIFLKMAAWCIQSTFDPSEGLVRSLRDLHGPTTAPTYKLALGTALAQAQLRLGQSESAEPILDWLMAQAPQSSAFAQLRATHLLTLRRWKDLETWATTWESKDPAGPFLRFRLVALIHQKREAEVTRALESAGPKGGASLWQGLALAHAEEHLDPTQGMDWARKGAQASEDRSLEGERVLSLALLEAGKPLEALEVLWRTQDIDPGDAWAPQTWYILGRIAESLQEGEQARRCYREAVRGPVASLADSMSLRRSAAERLKALGG